VKQVEWKQAQVEMRQEREVRKRNEWMEQMNEMEWMVVIEGEQGAEQKR
jgi:hypothetical protein